MKLHSLVLPLCALASSFLAPSVAAQSASAPASAPPAPRAITVDDVFEIRDVRDPQIADDGKWVAYTVSTAMLKEDKNETRIWIAPTGGGDAVAMSAEGVSSSHPRWSPDGKYLALLSKRNEGKTQVWLLNRMGGEAQKLTDAIQDVDDFVWSPDSKRLVLVLRDPTPEELDDAKAKDKDKPAGGDKEKDAKPKKPKTPPPFVIDRYRFKTDTVGYLDRRRTHLYVFDVATKAVVQITSGDFDDSEPAWSPDGTLLAFRSNRSTPDPDRTYDSNIWVVAADNTDKGAHLTQVTTNPGSDGSPAWSPDGKWITYLTQLDPKLLVYATRHVAVAPAAGGEARVLTRTFDRFSRSPRFSPDGKFVYFIADDDGAQNLCRVPVEGGEITRAISGHVVVSGYTMAKSGDLAALITSMDRPGEIFTTTISGGPMTRITHVNDALVAKIRVVTPEYVKFRSKDGTTVAGYLYKPLDYVAGKKYPTLLHPHGGPVGAYYGDFSHFSQLFAANGYVVLEPNPRGSSATDRISARLFSPTGATRIIRTTSPWSITRSRKALPIPTSSAWADGRTAAFPPTSSLRRPRASRPPFPARARRSWPPFTGMTSTSSTTMWNSATRGRTAPHGKRSPPFIESRTSRRQPCSWAVTSTGMFRSSAAKRCTRH